MAYKLKTPLGKAIYGARKCTVEPVIGIIKEVLGFRQFSLRGVEAAAGAWEWALVCLSGLLGLPSHLKRLHTLLAGDARRLGGAAFGMLLWMAATFLRGGLIHPQCRRSARHASMYGIFLFTVSPTGC